MSKKNDNLIPFGKYANQPVEVLQNDPDYVAWLTGQSWFQSRYPAIFNVVINKFGENEETPEHNKLQAAFLDKDVRLKTFGVLVDRMYETPSKGWLKEKWDSLLVRENTVPKDEAIWIRKSIDRCRASNSMICVDDPKFEIDAIDVQFEAGLLTKWFDLKIELKPNLGDDYPAVLRQMRNNHSWILVFESFCSSVVSEKTMVDFFESQKVAPDSKMTLESKMKNVVVIRFDQIIHFDFSKFSIEMNE